MPKMTVIKSVKIMRHAKEVFPLVHDFHNWILWSPWHILDEANNYKVSEDGSYYEWNSKLLGAGQMQRLHTLDNKSVESDLVFLKPWKSKSKIIFKVNATAENECEVIWEMHGKMPFFMFFMIKMMERMVGMDFMRGLILLKDLAEHGDNRCKLSLVGKTNLKTTKYIGIQFTCTFEEIGPKNKAGFERLMGFVREHQLELNGPPATIYHEFNIMKNRTRFTVAAPVVEKPQNLPNEMLYSAFQGGDFYAVELKGPYYHLGNAWSSISTRQRAKMFASDKNRDAIEVYLNSPTDTKEEELVTIIYTPIK